MQAFHDVSFPLSIAFGASGGPERRNEIIQLSSGAEKRNARMAYSRRRYDAGAGIRSLDDLYEVMAFFEARRGSLHAFRFRDPFDMKSCSRGATPASSDQVIGTGDGSKRRFRLRKTYGEGADAYMREITHPLASSVRVAVDGSEIQPSAGFSVDPATGEVVFASHAVPANGAVVTAGYVFDVPVRFDTDQLNASITSFRAGQIPSIPMVEVRS
ncbi:hypothetical protein EL18_01683 [Nitratireductor basaltis]|uniref:DUF2460 domain-containing protein n=2 Tax=Nitratireductor basaltis TaxID=472175 RepID=A0A084UCF9_9HYPH|nr:hypothetical protein EL18_01683 [Nitratireductor basaltis]